MSRPSEPSAIREDTPLHRMLTPADYVSLTNALLGLLAVFLISLDHVEWAILAIILAVIGDGVDGGLARIGHGGGPFGAKLDSFADFTAFAIAPATLLFHVYYQWEIITEVPGPTILTGIAFGAAGAAFFAAALLRLVRFEVLKGDARHDFFIGLSTPAAAVMVTIATYIGMASRDVIALTVVSALLMVSRFKYPKIRGALIAPALGALVLALVFRGAYQHAFPKLLLSMMVAYTVVGPFVVRWKAHRLEDVESAWS